MIPTRLGSWVLASVLLCGACGKKSADGASADGGAGAPGTGTKVKLALNWVPEPEFGGFYAARERGAYLRQGLDVEVLGGGAGVPVLQMVATGGADFGTVGGDELVNARARGARVTAIFATFQTSPQAIMVHASRKLTTLRDAFHSGTLAIEPGLPYAAYLKTQFPWDGVQLVPYDGGVARFLADTNFGQQCYITSEPIAARQKGGDPQVFLIADTGYNPYTTVVITRTELVQQKPEMVAAFVSATAEGWRAYLTDPKATNDVLQKLNPAMDAATLAAAATAQKPLIETEHTEVAGIGSMTTERWDTLAKQLADLKVVDHAPVGTDMFVPLRSK